MKIAIRTLRLTKRNLHVNPQPWTHPKTLTHHQGSGSRRDLLRFLSELCAPALYFPFSVFSHHTWRASPITLTQIFLSRGPSNSQKNTPCHCPNTSFPCSTRITWLVPVKTAFACESEFPSLCRYGPERGTKRSNTPSRSVATSGSKCSLIITPAVVCGTYR